MYKLFMKKCMGENNLKLCNKNVYSLASFYININYLTLYLIHMLLLYIKCF